MAGIKLKKINFIDPDKVDKLNEIPLNQLNSSNDASNSNSVTLTWEHINVVSELGGQKINLNCKKGQSRKKHILKNVDGIAKPGQILAIMGSSGSGKTTLFNCLNFRNKKSLKITGLIQINGVPIKSAKALSFISGYVEQDDTFIDTLTVKEHLTFHAMLRLGKNVSSSLRNERIKTVINDLNLKKCENTLIGDAEKGVKGISTGEKRRLAVATELLRNVNLLMADEPTSGLDSFMALAIIECLVNLARQGKTIICTIHQPSSEIFKMFDRLYLLAEGRVAFLGSLTEVKDFFNNQQLCCPPNYNPADFYIQKLAISPSQRDVCLAKVNTICDNFRNSVKYREMIADIDRSNQKSNLEKILELGQINDDYTSTTSDQLRALFWRSSINSKRDQTSTYIRTFQVIVSLIKRLAIKSVLTNQLSILKFFGIMFGLIYLNQDLTQRSIQNINGVLFMCLIESSFMTLMITTAAFCPEIPIILKEHTNGMYRISNYFISKIITELPLNIILPFTYITIIYWMANLNNQLDRFFICAAILVLTTNISVAFGGLISSFSRTVKVATQIASPLLVPLNTFAGYYLNRRTVPDYFIWMQYLSWIGYGNEALLINQWVGVDKIECTANSTCLASGEEVLKDLDMKESNFYMDIGIMVGVYFALRLLTYLMLLYRARKQK